MNKKMMKEELEELNKRKAALKQQMEQETALIKSTIDEIREEIEPANLLKKSIGKALGFGTGTKGGVEGSVLGKLPVPLKIIADLLIKDPKAALLVKFLAPLAMKYGKKAYDNKDQMMPRKSEFFGKLRKSIRSLRSRLHKVEKSDNVPEDNPESTFI